jgi:hypothetical protein
MRAKNCKKFSEAATEKANRQPVWLAARFLTAELSMA